MDNVPGADRVYEVGQLFRERCFDNRRSFLWPENAVWAEDNLETLLSIVESAGSFESTLNTLKSASPEIRMLAVDVHAAGALYPAVKRETQEAIFRTFLDSLSLRNPDVDTWSLLVAIFEIEVPGSYTHYKGGKFQNYLSWLFGLRTILFFDLSHADRDTIVETIRREAKLHEGVWDTQIWGMLHAMFPGEFVGVPGDADRNLILRTFSSSLAGKEFPNDFAALDYLRKTLPYPAEPPFDFYHPSLLQQWGRAKHNKRIEWLTRIGAWDTQQAGSHDENHSKPVSQHNDTSAGTLSAVTNLRIESITDIDDLLQSKQQLIFEGPPGSGKTYVAEKFARWFTGQALDGEPLNERVEIVQFHQSYGYEDFVQGIRPETNDDGQLVYRVRDGIFLDMCERAKANPEERFVLIIDEINRGNLSRIFGELLLLLEYRNQSVRLPYGSGDAAYLTIPENLYLIGTMNTADRSLAQIDYALRRRFYFVRFMPVEDGMADVFANWLAANDDIGEVEKGRLLRLFINLNEGIREHLHTDDLQVGHSYFMQPGIQTPVVFERVWRRAVRPLLEEYLHHHRNRDDILAALTPNALLDVPVAHQEQAADQLTDDITPAP